MKYHIAKTGAIIFTCLILMAVVNALEVSTTPALKRYVTPNTEVNFTIVIYGYPTPYNGTINVETDLVSPSFIPKGEGNVKINAQSISIRNITSPELQIQISGKTPIGKEIRYVKVFDKDLQVTKFNEGPYQYYTVTMRDAEGNIIDKKIEVFRLKFKELSDYDNLYNTIKNENIKEIAEKLMNSYQADTAIELLKAYKESQNQSGYTQLVILPTMIAFIVGIGVGVIIGKRGHKREEEEPIK